MRFASSLLAAGLAAAPALGQSFNIDIEASSPGWGFGVPPATFGAAAGQPGVWNAVSGLPQSVALRDLSGRPTSVLAVTGGSGSPSRYDYGRAGGDYGKLMEDGFSAPDENISATIVVGPLSAGPYFAYVYAGLLPYGECCATRVTTMILGHTDVGGCPSERNEFREGITHARHFVNLPAGAFLHIAVSSSPTRTSGSGFVAGVQVQKLPPRLYVNSAAPAGGNGLGWATAFANLQDALAQAYAWSGRVESIWVARGVYYPTATLDRNAVFELRTGVVDLYGGFAGNETQLEQRDLGANSTLLSGNIGGPLPYDNSRSILRVFDPPTTPGIAASVLDGFTIQSGQGYSNDRGAGLYMYGGELRVRNCRFVNNTSGDGGAVHCSAGVLTFADCIFQNNHAVQRGGAFAGDGNVHTATFVNCRFHGNRSDFWGGAADLQSSTASFMSCVFTGNAAPWNGGALHANSVGSVLNVRNCSFAGNQSDAYGAAISLDGGAHANLSNSILWDNRAGAQYSHHVRGQISFDLSNLNANFNTVQYLVASQWAGVQNNALDPRFVNATGGDAYGNLNDDLRLTASSPLVDAGANGYVLADLADLDGDGDRSEPTPYDLDRQARFADVPTVVDTGWGSGPKVDRGAYERQSLPEPR